MAPSLPDIARQAVRAWLAGARFHPERDPDHPGPGAAFVTLRGPDGSLRGCIGHLEPVHPHLAAEVAEIAVAAATRDPRFPAVTDDELDGITFSVSVLGAAEPVASPSELDPRRYGVIVSKGRRRGVLLPDIDGVDTVEQQLAIARRKAGIRPMEPVDLQRFRVDTHEGGG